VPPRRTCYHTLFVFNQLGDLEQLRPAAAVTAQKRSCSPAQGRPWELLARAARTAIANWLGGEQNRHRVKASGLFIWEVSATKRWLCVVATNDGTNDRSARDVPGSLFV
jgi:hypothetical protein